MLTIFGPRSRFIGLPTALLTFVLCHAGCAGAGGESPPADPGSPGSAGSGAGGFGGVGSGSGGQGDATGTGASNQSVGTGGSTAGTGDSSGTAGASGVGGDVGGAGSGAAGDAAGTAGTAGITGSGASGGSVGTGGTATAGTTGAGGAVLGVPAGYPQPTAANWQKCKSVPQVAQPNGQGGKVCPGGGAGPSCFECLFGGSTYNTTTTASADGIAEAGNYAVTVTLGGSAAGQTQIDAEANRILLAPTSTAAGQSVTYSFVVNVRANEGQPVEGVAAGYPGLDLFFSGPSATPPQVSAIGYALVSAATKPIVVYIASDSTACDQTDTDYAGWGQALPEHFAPPIGIANYADSGEGSGSFLNGANKWGAVKSRLSTGDWVLIQFGHNDGGTTSSVFQASMTQMVTDAKAKGALPLLISPPARATFSGTTLGDQSSLHAADTQAVATAQKVPYIDLTKITTDWYNKTVGSTGWQVYHAQSSTGSYDKTHTNINGAVAIAGLVADAIRSQNIGLSQYLR